MNPKLYVTAYADMAVDRGNRTILAPMMPSLAEQVIEITDQPLSGHPFPIHTRFIEILAETDCCIDVSEDPIAHPEYHLILEGERLFYGAQEGYRISVIDYILKDELDAINDEE